MKAVIVEEQGSLMGKLWMLGYDEREEAKGKRDKTG